MKNISLSLAALVLSLASISTSHAQSNAMYASNIVAINNPGNDIENSSIDSRAIKNFKKDFSTVDNAKWEQIPDGYLTKFVQKDIQFRIGYNQKGDWQYTERVYTASNLPIDTKKTVERAYPDYTINLVEEISTRQRTVYIVHIDNGDWSMKIKVDGTDTESIEEYKK